MSQNSTRNNAPPDNELPDLRALTLPRRRGFISMIVFLTSLLFLAAGWMVKGDVDDAVRPDSDDFVRAGELMIHWIASGGAGFEEMKADVLFPHYFVPSVTLAGIYWAFSDPVIKAVALNCVLFSVVVVLMYQFWMSVHGGWGHWSGKQGFFVAGAGGFYIVFGLPDPFLFSYTVLTDVIFLFWVAAFVVAASRGLLEGGWTPWGVALLMAVTAVYVRPTGMLLPILWLYAVFIYVLTRRNVRLRTMALISIGVPVVVTLLFVPWLVSGKINGSGLVEAIIPDLFRREFNQAVYYFKTGVVISDRPDTYMESPSSYWDVMRLIVFRLGYYLIPLRFGEAPYSVIHNIVNFVYILVAWPLMFLGVRELVSQGKRCRTVALFLIMVALSYALLHSVTLLSFGWRYQMPAMVPLWMLAGVGLFGIIGYSVPLRIESSRADQGEKNSRGSIARSRASRGVP